MSTADGGQRFSFGYHLNSWDLGGLELEPGLRFLAESGFQWFEALCRDGFSGDFVRRYMDVGDVEPPEVTTDAAWMSRIALFSRVQEELGLRLSSLYCNAEFVNPRTWPEECRCLETIARVLRGFGAPGLVLGGGPPATADRPHDADGYRALAAALNEIGDRAGALGLWTAYHPHLDTFVQTRDELDRLMEHLDPRRCGLCVDPAHLVLAGADPVAIVGDFGPAIRYVHYKDTRIPEHPVGAARYAAFCELGAGAVDLVGMTRALVAQGYDGLAIIELDVSEIGAERSATESIAFVRDALGLELTAP